MNSFETKKLLLILKTKFEDSVPITATYHWSKGSIDLGIPNSTVTCPGYLDIYGSLYDYVSSPVGKSGYPAQLKLILQQSLKISGVEALEFINRMPTSKSAPAGFAFKKRVGYQPEVNCSKSNYGFYIERNLMHWKSEDCSRLTKDEWFARMKRKTKDLSKVRGEYKSFYREIVERENDALAFASEFAQKVTRTLFDENSADEKKEEHLFAIIPPLASLEECILAINGDVGNKTHRQFFRAPDVTCKDNAFFMLAKKLWCLLSRQERLSFLLNHASRFRIEIVEALYPILHFAFNWEHGLALSFMRNGDDTVLVNAEAMCVALSEDDDGLFLESYAAFRIDIPFTLTSSNRDLFKNVETIQHSFLLFRKTFLDIVIVAFHYRVSSARADHYYAQLTSNRAFSSKKPTRKQRAQQARKIFNKKEVEETKDAFLERVFSLERIVVQSKYIASFNNAFDQIRLQMAEKLN